MADQNPETGGFHPIIILQAENKVTIDQLPEFIVKLQQAVGPLVGQTVLRDEQLRLFESTAQDDPWIKLAEWQIHYLTDYQQQYPNEPPGVWSTALFYEIGEMFPGDQVLVDQKGNQEGLLRSALWDLLQQNKKPGQHTITGKRRRQYLFSLEPRIKPKSNEKAVTPAVPSE
jgi:hypothetical protein